MGIKTMEKVKNIILVASGKGGVGKSTVAANLAVALSREGHTAGLFDADLYGPSIPMALGVSDQQPLVRKEDGKDIMVPIVNYGVKIMSLGFFIKKEDPIIWRGPMVSNTLTQLVENTDWGELEYLVIDMPPGTGDICITLTRKLPRAKALMVTTPQKMAVADGRKAANMFKANGIDIEILGVVENMSCFTPEKHPDEKYYLFGRGGGIQLAEEISSSVLAEIPLVSDFCELGDTGNTVFASENPVVVKAFEKLANTIKQVNRVLT